MLAPFFGYNFKGKRIAINLSDESDFSNGFARTLQRYVSIDIRKTEIGWRGDTPWLRNVIAHELSHKYTLDVLKWPIYVYVTGDAAIHHQGIEGGGTALLEHNRLPHWFVEGLAQLGAFRFGGDNLILTERCSCGMHFSTDAFSPQRYGKVRKVQPGRRAGL